jgi:hypothetical protein
MTLSFDLELVAMKWTLLLMMQWSLSLQIFRKISLKPPFYLLVTPFTKLFKSPVGLDTESLSRLDRPGTSSSKS